MTSLNCLIRGSLFETHNYPNIPWVQPHSSVMCWGQFWCDMFHSAAAGSIPFHRLGFSALTVTAPVLGVSLEDEGGGVILSGSWRKQGRVIPL